MTRTVPTVAALATIAGLAFAGPALAVAPRGGHYAESKDNVVVVSFDLIGGELRNFFHSDLCTRYELEFPPIRAGDGSFSYRGERVRDLNSQEWTVQLSGQATSRSAIRGSMTYQKTKGNARCRTTTRYSAVRTGRARG